jgi:hypothetical protein
MRCRGKGDGDDSQDRDGGVASREREPSEGGEHREDGECDTAPACGAAERVHRRRTDRGAAEVLAGFGRVTIGQSHIAEEERDREERDQENRCGNPRRAATPEPHRDRRFCSEEERAERVHGER